MSQLEAPSGNLPDALARALESTRQTPEDASVWQTLDDEVRNAERPDEASVAYREALERPLPKEALLSIGEQAVAFHEEWYASPDLVIGVLQRLVRIDSGCEWAFERLSLLLTLDERWDDLLAEYDQLLSELQDAQRRAQLLDEAARIAKDFAAQAPRASAYLKQLLLSDPGNDQLAESLERRLEQQGRHEDLIEIWQARLPRLSPAEALAARVRIAERYLEPLGDAERSLRAAEEILELPEGAQEATALLERLAESKAAAAPARRQALQILRDRYAEAKRAEDVIRVLELWLTVSDSTETTLKLHQGATEWLRGSGREEEALAHAAARLELSPEDTAVHAELSELAERTGRHDRFAEALAAAAEECESGQRRVELLLQAGDVSAERLRDEDAATDLYLRVLADSGAGAEEQLSAARKARPLLERSEQSSALLRVLERLADLEPEPDGQREALGQAARMADRTEDIDRALFLWQRCLDLSEVDREALDARIGLLERAERWEALIGDLRRRARLEGEADQQRRDWVRSASIYEHELDRLDSAIEVWRDIENQFSANHETTDALVRLCQADGRFDEVLVLLQRALETESDPQRRTQHLAMLGDAYRTQRAEAEEAVKYYRQALEVDPRHEGARAGLQALLEQPACAEIAVETLSEALKAASEWESVIELLPQRVAAASTPERRRATLIEGASLKEQQAGDPAGSLEFLCEAFELDPTEELEVELVRVAAASGDFARAAAGFASAVASCQDDERKLQLCLSRGRLLEEKLADPDGALESYRSILEAEPGHTEAACSAARVAISQGAYEALAHALLTHTEATGALASDLVEAVEKTTSDRGAWPEVTQTLLDALNERQPPEPKVEHDLRRQLGVWMRDQRGNAEQATTLLAAAARCQPDPDTLRMLAQLQRREPGPALVQTLLNLADVTSDELTVLHEAASVALETNAEPDEVRPILERAQSAAASAMQLKGGAEAKAKGDSETDADDSKATGEVQADADAPAQANASEAIASTERASEIAWWAVQKLVALETGATRHERALEILSDAAQLPFDEPQGVALRYQAAEVAAHQLGDAPRAIEISRGVLERTPEHGATIALLGQLFEREGRLEDLLELREQELKLDPDAERQLELRLDQARLLERVGRGRAQQLRALRKNLEQSPGHPASVEALEAILLSRNAHAALSAVLRQQAEEVAAAGDKPRAARLWARAGALDESALGDLDQAVAALRASVDLVAEAENLDTLARLHLAQGHPAEAVGWLEQRLELTDPSDVEARRQTLETLARALCDAGEEQRARHYLSEALQSDPGALSLRQLLASLYRDQQDWALLAPLLSEAVDYAPDDAIRVQLLREAAEVRRKHLGELEEALPLLERAVALDASGDRGLRLSLADGLRHAGRLEPARGLLEGLLEEFGRRRTKERARVHYHLAQIARAEGQLDDALDQLNQATSVDRNNSHMLQLLGEVARERGKLEEAERAYRTLLLLLGRSRQSEASDLPAIGESSVLFELHRIAKERGQSERAKELLDSALEAGAHDSAEARRLEQALRDAGHHDLLLRALEQRLTRTEEAEARAEVLQARGDVLESVGREAEALENRLSALELGARGEPLLRNTLELAEKLDQTEAVIAQLNEQAQRAADADPEMACELWLSLGAFCSERGAIEQASQLLGRAQATGFRAYDVLAQVERLGPRQSEEARENSYRLFVETADAQEQPEKYTGALYRLGSLELQGGRGEQGTLRIEAALSRDGDYARGVRILRQALEGGEPSAQVVELLEQTARQSSDSAALLVALRHRAALGDISPDLLQEAVQLARELGDSAELGALLQRTVELAREQAWIDEALWAVGDLVKLLVQRDEAQAAAELLTGCAEEASPLPAFELKLELARLKAEHLADLPGAAELYERLLGEEPTAVRVWKPLFQVYRQLGNQQALEERIEALEQHQGTPEQREALHLERIRILIDTERAGEAETALLELLEQHPGSDEAAEVLEQLLESQDRQEELRASIERRLQLAREQNNSGAVAKHALRLGTVLAPSDPQAAIRVFEKSVDSGCCDPDLLQTYLELLVENSEGSPERQASVMLSLLDQESGEEAERRALDLADLLEAEQTDDEAVERALERGLARCPGSQALHDRLVAYCESRGSWGRLAEQLVARGNEESEPGRKRELLLRAAELYERELSEPRLAAEALQLAIDEQQPDPELLRRVADAWLSASEPQLALQQLSAAVDAHPERDRTWAELRHLRAQVTLSLWPEQADKVALSIADLAEAAELEPAVALQSLADALSSYCDLLAAEPEETSREPLRESTMQLVRVLVRLMRRDDALERLAAWLSNHPEDTEALSLQASLAAEQGDHYRAADAYRALVPLVQGPAQVDAALKLASTCEEAGEPLAAQAALERVHAEQPGAEQVRDRLRRLYEEADAFSDWARLLLAGADNRSDASGRYELLCDAGELFLRADDSLQEAAETLERALELVPQGVRAHVQLAEAQVRLGQIEPAALRLDEAIRAQGKRRSPELSELQHAMAQVARAAGDEEAVFAWLEAALYSDRQNGVVASELAALAMARGDLDVAVKALQLVTLLKTPGPMSRAEAYLRQAAIAKHRGDSRKSALLAKRAVTTDPSYEEAKSFLAELGRQSSPPAE